MNDALNGDSCTLESRRPDASQHRLVIVALSAALATFSIAAFYPSDRVVDETMELSFGASYAWVGAQSFLLAVPGLLVGLTIGSVLPRTGAVIGSIIVLAIPVIVFCDVITFAWIGERFLSGTMKRIATTLAPAIALHVTRSSVIDAVIAIVVALIAMACSWWVAGWIARRWVVSRDPVGPLTTTMVLVATALLISMPAGWNMTRTLSEMREHSTRHPFCAFHMVGYRGVGAYVPAGEQATLARLRGLQSVKDVHERDARYESLDLDQEAFQRPDHKSNLLDVIIVVAESMRPEIIDPTIMPHLHAFTGKSIYCRQHFSEGNSTSYGVFGLLNGIEAVWFDRPVWRSPIMNRILHSADYELAFFGGEDDWTEFGMDGFIRAAHFDYFKIEYPDLLDTDYRSVQRTLDFILEGKRLAKEEPHYYKPRLGICYLLATHCRYISEEQDQVFQPAAPEGFMIPYTASAVPGIYNRYKNSARTLDRMIQPLLRDDCVVIVIGDHGESFLEDGSAIHGLRLSKVQNMTPMVMYYPGVQPRVITKRTMHADILPTLLSILGVPVNHPELFDGCDLTSVDDQTLDNRIFTTSNFMDRTTGLIGPWTSDPGQPFAYRFLCNIGRWQVDYLNPIDQQGYECADTHAADHPDGRQLVHDWMVENIGPEIVRTDRSEAELFTEFFHSSDRETRMSVLQIAADIGEPERYLYDLIADAVHDEDPEIRQLAKEIVIRTERFIGHAGQE